MYGPMLVKVTMPRNALAVVAGLELFDYEHLVSLWQPTEGSPETVTFVLEEEEWGGEFWLEAVAIAGVPFVGYRSESSDCLPRMFYHHPAEDGGMGKYEYAEARDVGELIATVLVDGVLDEESVAAAKAFGQRYLGALDVMKSWKPKEDAGRPKKLWLELGACQLEPCGTEGDPWSRMLGSICVGGAMLHVELAAAKNDLDRLGGAPGEYATVPDEADLGPMLDGVMDALSQEKGFQLATVEVPGVGPREYVVLVSPFDL